MTFVHDKLTTWIDIGSMLARYDISIKYRLLTLAIENLFILQ